MHRRNVELLKSSSETTVRLQQSNPSSPNITRNISPVRARSFSNVDMAKDNRSGPTNKLVTDVESVKI
eukprot:Pgem_evm1s17159